MIFSAIVNLSVTTYLLQAGNGWKRVPHGWQYLERGKVKVSLENAFYSHGLSLEVAGVRIFRDVDDSSICAYEGPRLLWKRKYDLGSPRPMVVGHRLLALGQGMSMIWGGVRDDETQASLLRRWKIRSEALRFEVISVRGKSHFMANMHDAGEPRCFYKDQQLWTFREINAKQVFLGDATPRYWVCLRNARNGKLLHEWKMPMMPGEEWFANWRVQVGPGGVENVFSSRTPLFTYLRASLRFVSRK